LGFGESAKKLVNTLLSSENPYHHARAAWLLNTADSASKKTLEQWVAGKDTRLGVVAFRALRQSTAKPQLLKLISQQMGRNSFLDREMAIALRDFNWVEKKALIERITNRYDGNDDYLLETIGITDAALRPVLGRAPRIAVAGLNPHAGEGGLFGDEEHRIIAPAIAAARQSGCDASGPWPPDTVFMQARAGGSAQARFDVVIAMYHDQGLIPVKYLGVEQGVNLTLGLPFVRTSPDHGTAFDIAGQGVADASSLLAAVRMACQWADAARA
jgi:hypothetical protein